MGNESALPAALTLFVSTAFEEGTLRVRWQVGILTLPFIVGNGDSISLAKLFYRLPVLLFYRPLPFVAAPCTVTSAKQRRGNAIIIFFI
jgi:hypothetical protein